MVWKQPALQRKALSYSGRLSFKADRMTGELQSWTVVISEHLRYFKRQHTWRRKWQPISVFLPEKSHGWSCLVGPWGPRSHKESDTTEQLSHHACVLSHFSCLWLFVTLWTWIPPGASVHGILQARILVWVAMPSSRGSSLPRDGTQVSYVSCIGRRVLYHWVTWESHKGQRNHGKPCQTLVACKIHLTPLVGDTGSPVGSIYVSAFL